MTPGGLEPFDLWTGLLGGLALFLLGMDFLTRGLKGAAGDRMRAWLARLTGNRARGILTGAVVTAVINSSSVTTVILVGFISAGLMGMAQALPVIMGANIGSTATAQLLAFKVTLLALPMISVGFVAWFVAGAERVRHYGAMVMGLGLVFHGMALMSEAMRPLRDYPPFLDLMVAMDNRFVGIAVGAVFTAVIQSSAATTGIVIVLAGQGLVSLEAGIALALGANIGTCATAGLAAIGKPREAVRAAAAHALFNVLGVLVWIGLLPVLADWVRALSPAAPDLSGLDRVAAEAPRQIANAHTLFNVANTLLFAPFTAQLARLVERLVPDRPLADAVRIKPRFIDPDFLFTPGFALDRAQLEIERLGRMVTDLVRQVMDPLLAGDAEGMRALAEVDERVDDLHAAIVDYLGRVSTQTLSKDETDKLTRLMRQANELEQIGDVVEHDVLHTGQRMVEESVRVSDATAALLRSFHAKVVEALESALIALRDDDKAQRKQVRRMKDDVRALEDVAARHQIDRLTASAPNRLHTFKRETELFEQLGNIFNLTRRLLRRVG